MFSPWEPTGPWTNLGTQSQLQGWNSINLFLLILPALESNLLVGIAYVERYPFFVLFRLDVLHCYLICNCSIRWQPFGTCPVQTQHKPYKLIHIPNDMTKDGSFPTFTCIFIIMDTVFMIFNGYLLAFVNRLALYYLN